jgi:two-component system OmpR family sensor kinase
VHHSLRRRLFRSFGLAILVSVALGYGVHALVEPSPWAPAFALVSAAVVLWMVAGGIAWALTRPLVELVSVARDLGEGKLDRRMRLRPFGGHGGEVALLAEAVNTMAGRIEQQLADQRELLAGVSHELRTPLGHLRVLIDTAREDPQLGPGGEAVLAELEREIVELDGLVDQLLAHSRLEFDRVERRPLDPVAVAVRALERVGEDASKLEVETELATIAADPTLLGRALANLLTNARTHAGGVEALRIYEGEDDKLCFCVDDRGPGFAEGERERVFESFVQGRERRGGSLGLGLSLVERIAKAHGGRAWARAREGGGASVGLCVAITDEAVASGDILAP